MSLEAPVDLGGLEVHSPEDLEVQGYRDVAIRNLPCPQGVQVDIGSLRANSQVDMAHPVGRAGIENLGIQGDMASLGST